MGRRTAVVVGSVAWAVVLGGIAFGLKPSEAQKVVTAEMFELVDKDGNQRLTMNINQEGDPSIALFGKGGELRASLGINRGGGPVLILKDEAQVVLMDGKGMRRAFLYTDKNGDPHFVMFDREDKPSFRAPDPVFPPKQDDTRAPGKEEPAAEKKKPSETEKK